MKITLLCLVVVLITGCQKQIWLDDVDCLLTGWTKKTWVLTNTDSTITYYWSDPKRLRLSNGSFGLWGLPEPGIIRETVFSGSDTLVSDYKIVHIDANLYERKNVRDTTLSLKLYHVK